jgi:hypothetical protein
MPESAFCFTTKAPYADDYSGLGKFRAKLPVKCSCVRKRERRDSRNAEDISRGGLYRTEHLLGCGIQRKRDGCVASVFQ